MKTVDLWFSRNPIYPAMFPFLRWGSPQFWRCFCFEKFSTILRLPLSPYGPWLFLVFAFNFSNHTAWWDAILEPPFFFLCTVFLFATFPAHSSFWNLVPKILALGFQSLFPKVFVTRFFTVFPNSPVSLLFFPSVYARSICSFLFWRRPPVGGRLSPDRPPPPPEIPTSARSEFS